MRARIAQRRPGERYEWTLHGYVGRPRVVSHRATTLPIDDVRERKSALRQAVVRIVSRQSLRKVAGRGEAQGEAEVKQITEYVVIQRRMWKGTEEPWILWGTVQETALEDFQLAINPVIPKIQASA